MIPGLSTLKTWGLAIASIAVAILYALFQHEKLARASDKLKIAKAAQKQQQKASEAMVKGLENEKQVENEKVDTKNRRGLQ